MAIKIKKLEIVGLRGIQDQLTLNLGEKSILLYGDNGTGKSSISDSLEWYYTDSVSHLSSSEIDLKDALRNAYLDKDVASSINIGFTKSLINSERKLYDKKGKLISEFSNTTTDFTDYLNRSKKENLILRYQFLRDFIDQTKGDKLKNLSDIIGFSEVTKAKEVLKKAFNSLKSEIKTQNFETQINTQKQTLIEKIGAAVSQPNNLFEKINEIIHSLNLGIVVASMDDIDQVLLKLKTPASTKLVNELRFLENCHNSLSNFQKETDFIDAEYVKYFVEFDKIASDVQSIMQTFLAELLKTGSDVLSKKIHKEESCPLCLQPKSITDLQAEIKVRLQEIEESAKKKASYDNAKQAFSGLITERLRRVEAIAADPLFNDATNTTIKSAFSDFKQKLELYQKAANEKVTSGNKLSINTELKLKPSDFKELAALDSRATKIKAAIAGDNTTVLYANILAAKDAFLKIKRFEADRVKLELQKNSLEAIYNEFVKRQKEGLQNFIDTFSGTINEFYQFMNPGELFDEIKIVTIGEDDELNGITIQYKYNGEWVSPPQKYFSESHLNCFGISFFLASVVAFNKENKFLILDDIISSFDTSHRKRFADLLFEKFSDYQIVLLTHEEEWFQYVRQLAKKKGWLINDIQWTEAKGTHLDELPNDLKELIETSITNGNIGFLGNPIRKYLEHILKGICLNLEVKMSFRFNDINEKRMPDEMLNELKSKINKSSTELKAKLPVIDRLANSSLLGNLLSHDNPFKPKMGDLKAFWDDILEFEKIFHCQDIACKKPDVAMKNYDTVAKKIRCGCDKTKYDWK
ncbi:ABC-type polysaccharide/polyol phosphate transport system ATPase subunit [Mucilaginibacter sp. UYP25]|uniref:AAA family ATPase n=1 Tax=unclassified Mucilaginibacter TaxID=2617802 RepID=UPI0033975882